MHAEASRAEPAEHTARHLQEESDIPTPNTPHQSDIPHQNQTPQTQSDMQGLALCTLQVELSAGNYCKMLFHSDFFLRLLNFCTLKNLAPGRLHKQNESLGTLGIDAGRFVYKACFEKPTSVPWDDITSTSKQASSLGSDCPPHQSEDLAPSIFRVVCVCVVCVCVWEGGREEDRLSMFEGGRASSH